MSFLIIFTLLIKLNINVTYNIQPNAFQYSFQLINIVRSYDDN